LRSPLSFTELLKAIAGIATNTLSDRLRTLVSQGILAVPSVADQMAASRSRSLIVAHYLEKRFHLSAKNIGLMPLNAAAPPSSGKDSWDGACIVLLAGTAGTK
jgi:hypothetical protein